MKVPFVNPGYVAAASMFTAQLLTPLPLLAAPGPGSQYNTAADIPQELFQNQAAIYGKVVKVTDGDTFRIRHLPNYPEQTKSDFSGKLSDYTIPIRLYAVDAPEIKKQDSPGMPFADEAKEWTSDKAYGKVVKVKLLQRDQYSRIIGEVTTTSTNKVDLSVGLVHEGLATIYTGKGAQYDNHKDIFDREVQWAQKEHMGMWYNGVENVQTSAEYKRSMKAAK